MNARGLVALLLVAGVLVPNCCSAQEPAPTAPTAPTVPAAPGPPTSADASSLAPAPVTSGAPVWRPDDRLILTGNGSTLSGASGGGGGSAAYLHQMNPDALLGAAVEYQSLAGAWWSFGSLSAAFSHALTDSSRWSVRGEVHEGEGQTLDHTFNYAIEALGIGLAVPGGLSADLEERQIDVDTDHGSLPKLALSKAFGPHWLTTVAYAYSFGGNLDTEYTLARVDFYGPGFNLLAGGSVGRVNPAVVNIEGILEAEARHLNEVFAGATKRLGRVELTLLGDELDLAGSKRLTISLTATLHLQ
jgi:hypothetical protein